jgi:hypothetical protein
MIVDAIAKISETGHFKAITDKIFLIKYDRNSQATSLFSSICDVRIIWGGDETIAQIRKSQLPPRSFDITFADRYSVCVINADEFIQEEKPEKFALGFYNDTYLFDQNACTAPHLVLWVGNKENVIKSKSIFWNQVHQLVLQKYGPVQPVIAVDKLTSSFSRAIKSEGGHVTEVKDNLLWRIELDKLTKDIEEFRCTSGYFLEYHAHTINELAEIINRKYQTIAYYGLTKTELHDFVIKEEISGIDRIVPIGQTTNFSFVWDGFDLINTLSRAVQIN